jgi:hypothetical protein
VCFLVAFLLNVQSIRYYSHASILINVPFKKMCLDHRHQHLSTEYVARSVNRGSYFGIWVRKKKLIKPRKLEKKIETTEP